MQPALVTAIFIGPNSPRLHRPLEIAADKQLALEALEDRQLLAVTTAVHCGDWHDASTWNNGVSNANSRTIISQGDTVSLSGADHVAEEFVVHGTLAAPFFSAAC